MRKAVPGGRFGIVRFHPNRYCPARKACVGNFGAGIAMTTATYLPGRLPISDPLNIGDDLQDSLG